LALGAALAFVAGRLPARATIILGSDTWDDASKGLMGWQSTYGSTQLSRQDPGGHPAGWLDISFPAISPFTPPGTNWYDLVYTPATNLFAGTWTRDMFVKFDFWASNQIPNRLAVRWQSLTNSYVWSHSVSVSSTQTWSSQMAGFGDWQDWVLGPGASEDMFLSDLSSIEWIGIYIERTGAGAQDYGLDNFNLMVPEPSEYAMLAAALMGAWIFLRRRPAT
jgi:hypothetical protein